MIELPDFVEFMEPGWHDLTCFQCHRAVEVEAVADNSPNRDDAQVIAGRPVNVICANEHLGINPESQEADWWEFVTAQGGWPQTGWLCGHCFNHLEAVGGN